MTKEATSSVVLHIDKIGRFGNYYYVRGWHTGPRLSETCICYCFSSPLLETCPEFQFYDKISESEDSEEPRKRFLHLFWVNDGYLAEISKNSPIQAFIRETISGNVVASVECYKLTDAYAADFITSIKQTRCKEPWGNRVALEIVGNFSIADHFAYFQEAARTCGWAQAYHLLREFCRGLNENLSSRLELMFYAEWARETDIAYMPKSLTDGFLAGLERLDFSQCNFEFAEQVVTQLARFAHPVACRLAGDIIQAREFSIKEISQVLRPCLPRQSQWWLHHTLCNQGLGREQIAEALNVAGHAAASQHQRELAQLCYVAALAIHPAAQSVSWNLGWLLANHDEKTAADHAFSMVSRHYPELSLCTAWPVVNGAVWPGSIQSTSGFQLPGSAHSWPRITIVTPSYNQGQYIEETILSVLNQNYPNLQYIVVDGNSTDDTLHVLERYRDRIDHLIIESDNGQTDAINKGFRLADGEILAWLNSDDIYAPGALHAAALVWLKSQPDVIAGQCLEHTDKRFLLINKPAARNPDFNPPQLARIFKYWLKGYYFYQPEVFFSKQILDKVGLLNESLYYSMDYDLWMRFAKAGASLEVIDWPVAFFRKHEAQKTTNLIDCIEEQARVRTSHYRLKPGDEREFQIMRSLSELRGSQSITVGILTKRIGKIFSQSIQQELDSFIDSKFRCVISDDETHPDIAKADLVILLVHVLNDLQTINCLRTFRSDRPVIGWFWDNHHHLFENHAVAEALDIVIPGHALYSEYLRSDQSMLGNHVPLCVTQWTRQDAAEWFARYDGASRKPNLYGGFVDYHFEPSRTKFLHKVMAGTPDHALSILSEDNLKAYFGRSEEDRFAEWCGYRTSLVLPLRNDLSQRVFDALLTGQIPLVPEEIKDLDDVIPREIQDSLPILRFSMKKPESCMGAYNKALALADQDGREGCLRRHQYALENAMFSTRITAIMESAFHLVDSQQGFHI